MDRFLGMAIVDLEVLRQQQPGTNRSDVVLIFAYRILKVGV